MKSISSRVYRSILTVCAVTILAMVSLVYFFGEDLEDTIVKISFSSERDYIIQNYTHEGVYIWDSEYQKIAFIPHGQEMPINMPVSLRLLNEGRVQEFMLNGQTFIGKKESVDTGVLYFAKNITVFEDREALFQKLLIVVTLLMFILSSVLSYISSRRLVRPWRELSNQISAVPIGKNMPLLDNQYQEAELYIIASNFNQFLNELNDYVKRENSLLSLASHELRTPIAVVAGALDIIESRQQLSGKDKITLGRIRQATVEMQTNVETLLKLARKEENSKLNEVFIFADLLKQVEEDLSEQHDKERLQIVLYQTPVKLLSDAFLSKMLLRNLVHNAMQHTSGRVCVTETDKYLEVSDTGRGLSIQQQNALQSQSASATGPHGFGLYIVTLVSERLEWPIEIVKSDCRGSTIRVHYSSSRYYL